MKSSRKTLVLIAVVGVAILAFRKKPGASLASFAAPQKAVDAGKSAVKASDKAVTTARNIGEVTQYEIDHAIKYVASGAGQGSFRGGSRFGYAIAVSRRAGSLAMLRKISS